MKAVFLAAWFASLPSLQAQLPQLLNYQGRVVVSGTNFDGSGQFKFALVNGGGGVSFWSNDGTSTAGSQPGAAVSLPVRKGLYTVLLGDTSLANMAALPAACSPTATFGCGFGSTTARTTFSFWFPTSAWRPSAMPCWRRRSPTERSPRRSWRRRSPRKSPD